MSDLVSKEMAGMEKKKQMRGPLGKVFFLKFKDILMINAGKDIKENSTAEPCRY
jgi:NAD(P)H-flavin reductase